MGFANLWAAAWVARILEDVVFPVKWTPSKKDAQCCALNSKPQILSTKAPACFSSSREVEQKLSAAAKFYELPISATVYPISFQRVRFSGVYIRFFFTRLHRGFSKFWVVDAGSSKR